MYLMGAYVVPERVLDWSEYPFSLPYVRGLDLSLRSMVTVFVGENGVGKTTLLSALAELSGLPGGGGGKNELPDSPQRVSPLAPAMRPKFRSRPRSSFYFRADSMADFSRTLDRRKEDPDFLGDPYAHYGGSSLRSRSHGQGVGRVLDSLADGPGLFFLDEPESALSPRRQLDFVREVERLSSSGRCQFVIATQSPIIISIAGAEVVSFDDPSLPRVKPHETSQWAAYLEVLTRRGQG